MKIAKIFLIVSSVVFLCSCSVKDKLFIEDSPTQVKNQSEPIEILWKSWLNGLDKNGVPFSSRFVGEADELQDYGKFEDAIRYYYLALDPALPPEIEEQIRLRLSSSQLLNSKAQESLDNLSGFYKAKNYNVKAVPGNISIMFGFIYGRLGNFSQSIAWFIQALADPAWHLKAKNGIELLLGAMDDNEILTAEQEWQSNELILTLITDQKVKRVDSPVTTSLSSNQPFWQFKVGRPASQTVTAGSGSYNITVVLPLSGRYANFGKSLEQGIKLALNDLSGKDAVVSYFDNAGGAVRARSVCEENVNGPEDIIIGGLLSEDAEALADCVRSRGATAITFTRKSEFKSGGGVYRIGMTFNDQMHSLYNSAVKDLGAKSFGIAYPADSQAYAYVESFKNILARNSLQPVFEYTYYKNPLPDFSELESEIKTFKPDVVLVIDNLDMLVRLRSSLSESTRSSVKIMGNAEWSDPDKLKLSQAILEGVIFVTPFLIDESPLTTSFVSSYNSQYGVVPDWLAAQGFDTGTLLAASIKRAIGEDRPINAVLNNIKEYKGLTGNISAASNGELNRELKVVEYRKEGIFEVAQNRTPIYVYRGNEKVEPESSPAE